MEADGTRASPSANAGGAQPTLTDVMPPEMLCSIVSLLQPHPKVWGSLMLTNRAMAEACRACLDPLSDRVRCRAPDGGAAATTTTTTTTTNVATLASHMVEHHSDVVPRVLDSFPCANGSAALAAACRAGDVRLARRLLANRRAWRVDPAYRNNRPMLQCVRLNDPVGLEQLLATGEVDPTDHPGASRVCWWCPVHGHCRVDPDGVAVRASHDGERRDAVLSFDTDDEDDDDDNDDGPDAGGAESGDDEDDGADPFVDTDEENGVHDDDGDDGDDGDGGRANDTNGGRSLHRPPSHGPSASYQSNADEDAQFDLAIIDDADDPDYVDPGDALDDDNDDGDNEDDDDDRTGDREGRTSTDEDDLPIARRRTRRRIVIDDDDDDGDDGDDDDAAGLDERGNDRIEVTVSDGQRRVWRDGGAGGSLQRGPIADIMARAPDDRSPTMEDGDGRQQSATQGADTLDFSDLVASWLARRAPAHGAAAAGTGSPPPPPPLHGAPVALPPLPLTHQRGHVLTARRVHEPCVCGGDAGAAFALGWMGSDGRETTGRSDGRPLWFLVCREPGRADADCPLDFLVRESRHDAPPGGPTASPQTPAAVDVLATASCAPSSSSSSSSSTPPPATPPSVLPAPPPPPSSAPSPSPSFADAVRARDAPATGVPRPRGAIGGGDDDDDESLCTCATRGRPLYTASMERWCPLFWAALMSTSVLGQLLGYIERHSDDGTDGGERERDPDAKSPTGRRWACDPSAVLMLAVSQMIAFSSAAQMGALTEAHAQSLDAMLVAGTLDLAAHGDFLVAFAADRGCADVVQMLATEEAVDIARHDDLALRRAVWRYVRLCHPEQGRTEHLDRDERAHRLCLYGATLVALAAACDIDTDGMEPTDAYVQPLRGAFVRRLAARVFPGLCAKEIARLRLPPMRPQYPPPFCPPPAK
jgi:hypothetical protein